MPMKSVAAAVLALLLAQDKPVEVPPWVVPPKSKQAFLEHHTFHSESMNVDVGYNVYLPPGHAESGDRKYPVIFWLHGFTCHESNDQFPAPQVDQAIKDGKIPPLIFVYGNGGSRAFYSDSTDGKILPETMIVREFIPYIEKTYRGMGTREGRALQGMSMGGHGALKLAFKYPELFSSMVAFAGGYIDEQQIAERHPDVVRQMFGGDAAKFVDHMPATIARRNADAIRGKLPVFMVIGKQDFLYEHNLKMHRLLEELKIEHEYVEVDGLKHDLRGLARAMDTRTLEFAARRFVLPK
jgi:S-formylglutathione hydrolase FrmB